MIKYVDSTGKNLLGNSRGSYKVSDLKLFSEDTKTKSNISFDKSYLGDTIVSVYPNSDEGRWFWEVKGVIADTLDIKFTIEESACCGDSYTISELYLNGKLIPADDVLEIKKRP